MTLLYSIFAICIGLISLGLSLALYRAIVGPDGATRAVIADLMFFGAISIIGIGGILAGASIVFDVVMLSALLSVASSVALSRVINRGHR